ncbi:hypothetical protein ABZW32_24645 [Streptomyces sp. NPDC004667]|uniref:hypothetical protein n=1 Tax=Streptomyces sp. NPDC004667 TaxID=3154285 RepID=UPI0033A78EBA
MEGRSYLGVDVAALDRLTDRQRELMRLLGDPDFRGACENSPAPWSSIAQEAARRSVSQEDVDNLLLGFQDPDSLRAFVLTELRVMGDENEQAEALLTAAGRLWEQERVLPGASGTAPANPSAAPAARPERRYTGITPWDGDIWCALDTRSDTQVYVRSEGRPGESARWERRPPRFRALSRYGERHWCGYDGTAGRWMYVEHAGAAPPPDDTPGWTADPPGESGRAAPAEEEAPELDEAVQGLVNAVRSGAITLTQLSTPARYAHHWAALPSLGSLAEAAARADAALEPAAAHSRGEACRSVAALRAELHRIGSRFGAMERWPEGWNLDDGTGPDHFAHMIRLGCQDLRRSVRRIVRAPQGGDPGAAARQGGGREEAAVAQVMANLVNFAWAMGRTRCHSETFADPLNNAERLARLNELHEACPDLASTAVRTAHYVVGFQARNITGRDYDLALRQAQKVLRRYSEQLFTLEDRWPGWGDDEDAMPAQGPTAYGAMMRLGWQMLEAERRELRTFLNWEGSTRSPNMGRPAAPGNSALRAVRAGLPKRSKPPAPLTLPGLAELRALVGAMAAEGWPASAFARPLTALETWRASSVLRDGYPEFRDRAAAVARLYEHRATDGEAYRDAVARLLGVLEAVRTVLGLMGPEWPSTWAAAGHPLPEESPAVLRFLIEDGKKELRRSARNLAEDVREESEAAAGRGAGAPRGTSRPGGATAGRGAGRRGGSRRDPAPPSRRRHRQRSASSVGSTVRRFFFGGGRDR